MGYPSRMPAPPMVPAGRVRGRGPALPGNVPLRAAPGMRIASLRPAHTFNPYGVADYTYGDDGLGFKIGNPLKAVGKAAKFVEKKVTRPIGKGIKHGAQQIVQHPLEAAAIAAGAGFALPFVAPVAGRLLGGAGKLATGALHIAEKVPGVTPLVQGIEKVGAPVVHGLATVGRGIQKVPGVSIVEKAAALPFVLGTKAGGAVFRAVTGGDDDGAVTTPPKVNIPKIPLPPGVNPVPISAASSQEMQMAIDALGPGLPADVYGAWIAAHRIQPPTVDSVIPEMGPGAPSFPAIPSAPAPVDQSSEVKTLHRRREKAAADANSANAQIATLSAQMAAMQQQAAQGSAPSGWESIVQGIEQKIQDVRDTAQKATQIVGAADQALQNAQAAAMNQPLPYPSAPDAATQNQASLFSNPVVLGGLAIGAVLLLTHAGGGSSGGSRAPRRRRRR